MTPDERTGQLHQYSDTKLWGRDAEYNITLLMSKFV